jgi:hypothetical protein
MATLWDKPKKLDRKVSQGSIGSTGAQSVHSDNAEENFVLLKTDFQNCWICEGWVETEFELDLQKLMSKLRGKEFYMSDNLEVKYSVCIHFDFDDYQPDLMEDLRKQKLKYKGLFKIQRMLPQGKFHYFFSFEDDCFTDATKPQALINPLVQQ